MSTQSHPIHEPAPRVLHQRAALHGDRPRYHVQDPAGAWQAVTWQSHADSMRDIACWLQSLGLSPGDRGTIFAHNRVQWMEAALGLQAAGLAMVPIYPASTAEQAAYVATHSEARVLFVAGADLLAAVFERWSDYERVVAIVVMDDTDPQSVPGTPEARDLERRVLHWSTACALGRQRHASDPDAFADTLAAIDLDQTAIMLYTSGTTGRPKGVPLTHRNIGVNAADWMACVGEGLGADDVDLLWLPMSHIFGFGEACLGNDLGFTTYLSTPSDVVARLPTVRPTVFMSVPAYWEKLALATATHGLSAATGGRLRFCLSGGAGLALSVKEAFAREGLIILEGYGLTECSPTLTLNRQTDYRFDSVGKAVPSVQLVLAADGEILARGPNIFRGYHRDAEATKAAIDAEGWFHTGDLGRFTDDGFLQIIGRKKEILVTAGGKNVAPGNIEALFVADPRFERVVVYGDGKKYLVAGVWLDDSVTPEQRATQQAWVTAAIDVANTQLARCEQIKRFAIMGQRLTVADGHLTATLKLRRASIYAAFADQFEALYA